jgi:hypothetical protein
MQLRVRHLAEEIKENVTIIQIAFSAIWLLSADYKARWVENALPSRSPSIW